jgi:hypothetical protein
MLPVPFGPALRFVEGTLWQPMTHRPMNLDELRDVGAVQLAVFVRVTEPKVTQPQA